MEEYGSYPGGRHAHLFTLRNKNGVVAQVTDYGARLVSVTVPGEKGQPVELTLGYDHLEGWLGDPYYLGATVGRYGNRIANGEFQLNGETYHLAKNNEAGGTLCHLHGGISGFSHKPWEGKQTGSKVTLHYQSFCGEEGYPGTIDVIVTYELTDENELIWKAEATTDKATPVNIILHTYWNMTGNPSCSILAHDLMVASDHYLPTAPDMIPTGEIAPVAGTPFDFTSSTPFGDRIEEDHPDLKHALGYDHCYVLSSEPGVRLAAIAKDSDSNRSVEFHTDQPGLQVYTGNYLCASVPGRGGRTYQPRTGFCLETQAFPDSPNQPDFPSTILQPGEKYEHTLIHRFAW